ETTPRGRQPKFTYNVSWAVTYMERAGLLERVGRGVCRLTEEGQRLLSRNPERIDKKLLEEYPRYAEWMRRVNAQSRNRSVPANSGDDRPETPEEILSRAALELNSALEADVLEQVRNAEPSFLERVVVDLLIRMGYGGGDPENGRVTGQTGDGGIDGTIREDALGLDEVYVQAKKYADSNTVGEGELRNFAGAIDAAGTTKGVFVTTSGFTRSARDYVSRSPKRIILIDGEELARLMVRHGIGVRTRDTYEIKRIDEDYFDQEAL
ncbi:MAG: restriction endonuclease, partial [Gammaproteobacteria bacterium]|nr:restriction endonuclease [Gammaproteobacteria bacterium]